MSHAPDAGLPESTPATPAWEHTHRFSGGNPAAERGTRLVMWITATMMVVTRLVMWITATMMVVEVCSGWWFNSMALLADGWHMSSHAVAIGLSALAYAAARRYAQDRRFAFGTWKIEVLGGFSSALFLLGVAVMMVLQSVERLLTPLPIHYLEALVVGVLGLAVNLLCALILHRAHGHRHPHDHGHDHHHGEHGHPDHATEDLNLRAAYLHVVADATTSVLAILALAGGWWLGWTWLDAVMGVAGAVLVGHWAVGLVRDTSSALLDRDMDHPVVEEIREALALPDDAHRTELTDLHVWRVGQTRYACALTLVTSDPQLNAARIRQRLAAHPEIAHLTVEIHHRPASHRQP